MYDDSADLAGEISASVSPSPFLTVNGRLNFSRSNTMKEDLRPDVLISNGGPGRLIGDTGSIVADGVEKV
jgi:hypothetical protein